MAVDWTNPCERVTALREAYFRIVSGDHERVIRYKGPQGERETQYTAANLAVLKQELDRAIAECEALTDPNAAPRRFVIRGGAMRRRCF